MSFKIIIMKQLTLELFLQLFGIGAASGLIYKDDQLQIISDDANVFYTYEIAREKLTKNSLNLDYSLEEQLPKAVKNDFEAITTDGEHYYIFGSGSTPKRNKLIEVSSLTKEIISINDLEVLYESMKSFAAIADDDFNIEGVIVDGNTWYFFNRGNGPAKKNGVFTVTGANILEEFNIVYNPIQLPKIDGVQTGFTDATLVDNKIYFLAAAEDADSTYQDGDVKGTLIGRMDLKKLKVEKTTIISNTHKFEGISLLKKEGKTRSFLLCEDADNTDNKTKIYKLDFKE